jgi:hypothetical protein
MNARLIQRPGLLIKNDEKSSPDRRDMNTGETGKKHSLGEGAPEQHP